MISKPLNEITLADLNAMIGQAREGKMLEFKREPSSKAAEKQLLKGVSGFANAAGGDFILGLAEKDGVVESIPGIAIENIDQERLRIESLLRDGLEPRLPRSEIAFVPCDTGRYVVIVRAPHSWVGPHRLKSDNHFYARNSAGTCPLDVGELRTAFVLSETGAERIREFRAERLAKILSGETPVPLERDGVIALHVVPFPSFADRQLFDITAALKEKYHFPLPLEGMSGANQAFINLDGVTNYLAQSAKGAASYVQLFRSGAIEGVSLMRRETDGSPYLPSDEFANMIVAGVRQYLSVLNAIESPFPVFVMLSLCGAKGCWLKYVPFNGLQEWQSAGPLDREVIALPEIGIDRHDADVPTALRPIFNILWNGFGFLQCPMYMEDGTWKGH